MSGAAIAQIDLAALRTNLKRARVAAPDSRIMAVVKSNAYGHGAVAVSKALADADALAVARVSEGAELREAGIETPILVLEGFHDSTELASMVELDLHGAIHSPHQVTMLESAKIEGTRPVNLWIKLDTGMNRLGFPPNEFRKVYETLRTLPFVNLISVMTHFSNADDLGNKMTERQMCLFDETAGNYPLEHSLANSAALLGWPASRRQWVRPGIMLYGASPFLNGSAANDGLVPVMTLYSKLISVRQVPTGESVGYGGEWTATRDSVIGVVAAGYGDGYPRHAPNGTPALVNGIRSPLVGRISMDMLTIDLTENTGVSVGDEVVLWGKGLPAEEIAAHVGAIPYEMFCGITRRTRFEYV